jgi:glucose-6-phosphate 1-dehydrogenase
LATSPDLFGPVCRGLAAAQLVTPLTRVVLEKPLGHDLASAQAINDEVGEVFAEDQTYRIDHYLGKETVQNLITLRFANFLVEPLWNSNAVDHVQITVAESLGVGERVGYYDKSGALRDMVQNHLLQLLCLVAMEPPTAFEADAVRDEKLKVLRALKPIGPRDVAAVTVRGQYRAGAISGQAVPGYLEELGGGSDTETFVVVKAEVQSWRWAGVPFYLRTGKRLGSRASEIIVQYRNVPYSIFSEASRQQLVSNRLVLRLQPDEGMKLYLMSKDPGPGGLRFKNEPLNLSYAESFAVGYRDAYERLLMDVVRGNPTLFMRKDEVAAAWRWIDPILDGWKSEGVVPKPYPAGSWGPSDATALIARDGRAWHEDFT